MLCCLSLFATQMYTSFSKVCGRKAKQQPTLQKGWVPILYYKKQAPWWFGGGGSHKTENYRVVPLLKLVRRNSLPNLPQTTNNPKVWIRETASVGSFDGLAESFEGVTLNISSIQMYTKIKWESDNEVLSIPFMSGCLSTSIHIQRLVKDYSKDTWFTHHHI